MKRDLKRDYEKMNLNDFNYRDESQQRIHAFMLKVLKSFNSNDLENNDFAKKFVHLHRDEYSYKSDLISFKAAVEHWLRTKFFKFSVSEIKYMFKVIDDYRENQDTKGWLLHCLSMVPVPIPEKEKVERKKLEEEDRVTFDFLSESKSEDEGKDFDGDNENPENKDGDFNDERYYKEEE